MLTEKQAQKYWRTWAAVCREQGWKTSDDDRRRALHAAAHCPGSMREFANRDFSRWLQKAAELMQVVDIRDRDRENAIWTIERLRAGFVTLLGHDYARTLVAQWREWEDFDLDKIPLQNASKMDLQNLRNTLKNRLGRVITRLQDGELTPGPDCPKLSGTQQDIISDLIAASAKANPARRNYTLYRTPEQPGAPKPHSSTRKAPGVGAGRKVRDPEIPGGGSGGTTPPPPRLEGKPNGYCMH